MRIVEIRSLAIPEITVIRYERFTDGRGYFTEPFRQSDISKRAELGSLATSSIAQMNESYSRVGTLRGLHFQWNPYMGKLVRTLHGRMIDLVLDIRLGSPTYGKAVSYDMPASESAPHGEWIWVPPGFAHGNFFPEETSIEYLCTGEYSPGCEAGIWPLAEDIDWSLATGFTGPEIEARYRDRLIVSEKDRVGLTVEQWTRDERARTFQYGRLP